MGGDVDSVSLCHSIESLRERERERIVKHTDTKEEEEEKKMKGIQINAILGLLASGYAYYVESQLSKGDSIGTRNADVVYVFEKYHTIPSILKSVKHTITKQQCALFFIFNLSYSRTLSHDTPCPYLTHTTTTT